MKLLLSFLLLNLISNACVIYAKEFILQSSYIQYPAILNNEEIIFVRKSKFQAKKTDEWGYPYKYKSEIIKKHLHDSYPEKTILNIEYEEIYLPQDPENRIHYYRIYKDKRFDQALGISGVDVCWKTKQIAFSVGAWKNYMRAPEPQGGIFTMDFEGDNIKRLIPYRGWEPHWNRDGTKILFKARKEEKFLDKLGSERGVFLYDLLENKYQLVTDNFPPEEYFWLPDESGIYLHIAANPEKTNFRTLHTVKLDGSDLKQAEKSSNRYLPSPDELAWTSGFSIVYKATIPIRENKVKFENIRSLRHWFPDSTRLLGENKQGDIVVADINIGNTNVLVNGP